MSSIRPGVSEEEINELISKLQSLLPDSRRRSSSREASAAQGFRCSGASFGHEEAGDFTCISNLPLN